MDEMEISGWDNAVVAQHSIRVKNWDELGDALRKHYSMTQKQKDIQGLMITGFETFNAVGGMDVISLTPFKIVGMVESPVPEKVTLGNDGHANE